MRKSTLPGKVLERGGCGIDCGRTIREAEVHSLTVLVTTSWPRTEADPAGHFVRAHARELERGGERVRVLTPEPGGAFGAPGFAARVRARPTRLLAAVRWVLCARGQVKRLEPRRVVAHWAVPSAWPVGVASSAPLSIVSHGGDVRLLVALPHWMRAPIVRALIERAEKWEFVSRELLDELLASLNGDLRASLSRRATIKPAALELPEVGAAVARRRAELGSLRVAVSVCRLVPKKRVDRAICHIAKSREYDVLVVLGDGPERRRLERQARAEGVRAWFLGEVGRPEALAWIGAADAVLHASEAEGLSTVLREAAHLGTRVVMLEGSEGPAWRYRGLR